MRTLLVAPLLASIVAAAARPADACGGYIPEPRVFQLTSHIDGERANVRTFAHLGQAGDTSKLSWRRLAPGTYDYVGIADAPDLERAMDITLIGPSGARVVTSSQRVFIDHTFVTRKPTLALEVAVKRGEFTFAIAGRHEDASWIELGRRYTGKADLAWVKARGVTPLEPQYVSVSKLGATQLETIEVLTKDSKLLTFVRSGTMPYTQFEGQAVGGFSIGGERYVLARHEDSVRAIAL